MKAYTDLEQSKILGRILPLSSADMGWNLFVDDTKRVLPIDDWDLTKDGSGGVKFYHAWSLTALLNILPHPRCFQGDKPTYWFCGCLDKDYIYHEVESSNPIDACVDMIVKLHEKNLL